MELNDLNPVNLAALTLSVLAIGLSLLALFPSLRGLLVVARDAVLWVALLVILGAAALFGWREFLTADRKETPPPPTENASLAAPGFSMDVVRQ